MKCRHFLIRLGMPAGILAAAGYQATEGNSSPASSGQMRIGLFPAKFLRIGFPGKLRTPS